jgi:hypothetical protein
MAPAESAVQVPVSVVLTAQGDVEARSLGVQASGNGTLTDATVQGTVGADVSAAPPGLRNTGFESTELAAAGAVSAVDLSFTMPIALPDGSSNTVLSLIFGGTAPAAGSSEIWGLQFVDGIQGSGQPVQNIVSVDGLSFVPAFENYQVEVIGQLQAVPEPSTFALTAFGLFSLAFVRWRRRRR